MQKKAIKSRVESKRRLSNFVFHAPKKQVKTRSKWRALNKYSKISNPVEKVLGCFHAPLCLSAVELWRAALLCVCKDNFHRRNVARRNGVGRVSHREFKIAIMTNGCFHDSKREVDLGSDRSCCSSATNGGRLWRVEVAVTHAVGVGISEARWRGGTVSVFLVGEG